MPHVTSLPTSDRMSGTLERDSGMFLVIFGPPGAGKGTQARRLVDQLDIPHLSTGEMLRDAKAQGSEVGLLAAKFMDHGRLAPDQVVVDIVAERLQQPDCARGCLFDGFPRTIEQARLLDEHLQTRGLAINLVIELVVDFDELERRMLNRAKRENRVDDTPETISRRMAVFRKQTAPLLDFYRPRGIVAQVDGMGTQDEVFARLSECVGRLGTLGGEA
jgi:adenylate kinase